MRSTITLRVQAVFALCCATSLVYVFFFGNSYKQYAYAIHPSELVASVAPAHTQPGVPIRLLISKIGLDTAIESISLTSKKILDTPKDPAHVGWFTLSRRPGEIGVSVIDGHFGWKDGIPAAFDNLHSLTIGDLISVTDEVGVVTTFIVRKVAVYNQTADASVALTTTDKKVHLNLITCKGDWNPITHEYTDRLVVFSDQYFPASQTL
ncbi:MAG: hypothetical protein RLZZ347_283 [Candidatus Parcubacteria bacterium]|jgi:hypothetical protein